MEKQSAAPKQSPAPIKPARELVDMVKKLPREDQPRIESFFTGLGRAQKTAPPAPNHYITHKKAPLSAFSGFSFSTVYFKGSISYW